MHPHIQAKHSKSSNDDPFTTVVLQAKARKNRTSHRVQKAQKVRNFEQFWMVMQFPYCSHGSKFVITQTAQNNQAMFLHKQLRLCQTTFLHKLLKLCQAMFLHKQLGFSKQLCVTS